MEERASDEGGATGLPGRGRGGGRGNGDDHSLCLCVQSRPATCSPHSRACSGPRCSWQSSGTLVRTYELGWRFELGSWPQERAHNPRLTLPPAEFVDLMTNMKRPYPAKIGVAVPANLACGVQGPPPVPT